MVEEKVKKTTKQEICDRIIRCSDRNNSCIFNILPQNEYTITKAIYSLEIEKEVLNVLLDSLNDYTFTRDKNNLFFSAFEEYNRIFKSFVLALIDLSSIIENEMKEWEEFENSFIQDGILDKDLKYLGKIKEKVWV